MMGTEVIFTSEVMHHVDVCNRYPFRLKELFYALKDRLLKRYAEPDGYDLQVFYKYRHYWEQFYHWDIWHDYKKSDPPEVWLAELANKWCVEYNPGEWDYELKIWEEGNEPNRLFCSSDMNDDNGDVMVRCISEHKHILQRYKLIAADGSVRVYHCPTNEFYYRAFRTDRHPEIVKRSEHFANFFTKVINPPLGLMHEDDAPVDVQPYESFKWLIRWWRANYNNQTIQLCQH